MTNDALLERFTVEHFDRNSIGEHRRAATMRVLNMVAAAVAPRSLAEITPSDVMGWQASEVARGIRPNTVRNRESMLHAFIRWLHLAQLIDFERATALKAVPAVRGAHAPPRPRPYKLSELHRLREVLAIRFPVLPAQGRGQYALRQYKSGKPLGEKSRTALRWYAGRLQLDAQISLALEEGLRCGEVAALTLVQMHPDNESVLVKSLKSRPGEVRMREVPYAEHSRECVRDWLELRAALRPDHDRPWLTLFHQDLTSPEDHEHMRRSLRLLDPLSAPIIFRWHRLRHTFATERLRAGLPLEKLQVMMGHANLQQTLAYAEIVNADLVSEAERTADAFARNLGFAA